MPCFGLIEVHQRLKFDVISSKPKRGTVVVAVRTVSGYSWIAIIMAYLSCPQRGVRCLFFYFHFLKHLCYVINWITMDESAQNTKEVKQSALQGLWSSRTLGAASLFLPQSLELADAPLTFHVSNILRKRLSSQSWGARLPVRTVDKTPIMQLVPT